MSEQEKQGQAINNPKPPRKSKKGLVIGGICAAVLALAVVIGVVVVKNLPGQWEDNIVWEDNILMEVTIEDVSAGRILGSDIPRDNIKTITFVDSLKGMPDDAWDVSADGRGKVMAWVEKNGDRYYDLYIGAKGGVAANENSSHLFSNYVNVEQILINGNFHTENAKDMFDMFCGCEILTDLDVSGFDTSNVTDMGGMFAGCVNLTDLDVSGFDTSSVANMDAMFADSHSLTDLDVSGFDTSNVTHMCMMFYGCYSQSLDVSGFDTSRVTDMRGMFAGCINLTDLDVSGFDASSVTDTTEMFYSCNSLTSLDLSNFTPEQIDKMGIPEGVTVYQ